MRSRSSSASSSRGHSTLSYQPFNPITPSSSTTISTSSSSTTLHKGAMHHSLSLSSINSHNTNNTNTKNYSSSSSLSQSTTTTIPTTNTNSKQNTSNNSSSSQQSSTLYLNNIILDDCSSPNCSLFKIDSTQPNNNNNPEIILSFPLLYEQLRNYIVLKKISSITHIYLEQNNLSKIEDLTSSRKLLENPIRFLQYLNLSSNQLSKISFFNLVRLFPSLEFLILRSNQISSITTSSIPIYGNIKVLDLSCNKLKRIEGILPLRFSLQVLNIQKNEIESYEDMKQVLELEILTNIDFRGNPIKSLDEENLIFEEILDKCSNVWFINGATTLASPLVETTTSSGVSSGLESITSSPIAPATASQPIITQPKSSPPSSTTIGINALKQSVANSGGGGSSVTQTSNGAVLSSEEKLKSAEEMLKKHSYIIEHFKNYKSTSKQSLSSGSSVNASTTPTTASGSGSGVALNQSNNPTATTTQSSIYNDPAILKNLANFAKSRSKRSDSCPTKPSPSKQQQHTEEKKKSIPSSNKLLLPPPTTNNSKLLQQQIEDDDEEFNLLVGEIPQIKDRNTLKMMELKSFENDIRNRQQARFHFEKLEDQSSGVGNEKDDQFLLSTKYLSSTSKTLATQQQKQNVKPTLVNESATLNSVNNGVRQSKPMMTIHVNDNNSNSTDSIEPSLATIESATSTLTLEKLQSLIDSSSNAPPTPLNLSRQKRSPPKDESTTPPLLLISTPSVPSSNDNTTSSNTALRTSISSLSTTTSNVAVSPALSTSSSRSSSSSGSSGSNNSSLNISAIPHSTSNLNQSALSISSMNLSSINNASFISSSISACTSNSTTSSSSSASTNATTTNSTPSTASSSSRALSIKERAKQNMLKKLNM